MIDFSSLLPLYISCIQKCKCKIDIPNLPIWAILLCTFGAFYFGYSLEAIFQYLGFFNEGNR